MISVGGISVNWFIIAVAMMGLIYALRAFIALNRLGDEAKADYAYKNAQKALDPRIAQEDYVKIYRYVHRPRKQIYIAAAILALFVITPISFVVFDFIYRLIYNASGQSRVIEPGFLVWQFFLFFFFIINCVTIIYFMARRFYSHAPSALHHEIERFLQKLN